MSQMNASFNLQSNVSQVIGQINQSLGLLNRRLSALDSKAQSSGGPMDRLAGSIQKISANVQGAADGTSALVKSIRALDRSGNRIQNIVTNVTNLNTTLANAKTGGIDAYAKSIKGLADSLKVANSEARGLLSTMKRLNMRFPGSGSGGGGRRGGGSGGMIPPVPRGGPGGMGHFRSFGGVGADGKVSMLMPRRSMEEARALQALGSAAQGAAIGMSILQRNMMGVIFGLIFMQFGVTKIILAFAALTVVLGSTVGLLAALIKIETMAFRVGAAFEETGQRLASFFRSADMAKTILRQGEEISRTFGVARDQATGLAESLAKFGLNTDVFFKAILNASAATGEQLSETTARFTQILKADSASRQGLIEKMILDYSLPVKSYTSALELAQAMNERFRGSAEAAAGTTAGMWRRVQAGMQVFMERLGVIMNAIIKPFVELILAFTDALIAGFDSAYKAAGGVEFVQGQVNGLRDSVRKLIPWVQMLGSLLGKFLFWTLIRTAQALKTVADVVRSSLKWFKSIKDEVRTFGVSFSTNFLDAINNPEVIGAAIGAFITTFVRVFTTRIGSIVVGGAAGDSGFVGRLLRGLLVLPEGIFRGLISAIKTGLLFALAEAFTLTAIDMLPISESAKTSLEGIVRGAFTGAAFGTLIPVIGPVFGALIGAGIAAGFELAAPGSVSRFFEFVDNMVIQGLKEVPGAVAEAWGKLQEFSDWLLGDGQKGPDQYVSKYGEIGHAFEDFSDGQEKHKPRIIQFWDDILNQGILPVSNYIKDQAMAIWRNLQNAVGDEVMGVFESFRRFLMGSFWDALKQLIRTLDQTWDTFDALWKLVDGVVQPVFEFFATYIQDTLVNTVLVSFSVAMGGIKLMLEVFDSFIRNVFVPGLKLIEDVLRLIEQLAEGDFSAAMGTLKDVLLDVLNLGASPLKVALDGIKSVLDTIKMITGHDISANLVEGFGLIGSAISGAKDVLVGSFDGFMDSSFIGALKTSLKTAAGIINTFLAGYNNTIGAIPGWAGGPGKIGLINTDSFDYVPPTSSPAIGPGTASSGGVPVSPEIPPGQFAAQHGGIVPGPRGSKRWVLAEAGEAFGGHPDFATATSRNAGLGGGSGGGIAYFDLRGAVIADESAMDKFAGKIGERIGTRWFNTRRMALPRTG